MGLGAFCVPCKACLAATKSAEGPNGKGTAVPAWLTLPPTRPLPIPSRTELADINQTRIFFAQFGKGPPVLLLHGGLGSSDYWGYQIQELAEQYSVTVMDTRGHGRSPVTKSYSFELFANDASALLDFLRLSSVAVIGWSDGAITGLQLAINHDKRVSKLFAFGANATLDGGIPGGSRNKVFASYVERCKAEYSRLSPHPEGWGELVAGLGAMWQREPNFTKAQLGGIKIPVTVADGEHDEIIKSAHTKMITAEIPGAKLVIPGVSHFAMLQNPPSVQSSPD